MSTTPSFLDRLRDAANSFNYAQTHGPSDQEITEGFAKDHPVLGPAVRFLQSGGETAMNTPSALKHAFTDPVTPEENSEVKDTPESLKPLALGTYRLTQKPTDIAVHDYLAGRVSPKAALSVLPEALGTATGTVAAGAVVPKMAELAGAHPAVASQAIQEHAATGGSTIEPTTGKSLSGSRNVAVGLAPEHAVISDRPFNAQQYQDFVNTHGDFLSKNPKVAVGTHYDPATGLHHMELVGLTPSKTAAVGLANDIGENHVYDLATDEKIPTGIEQGAERPLNPSTLEHRISELNARSPQKQPYTGIHYADDQLQMIDGTRRGIAGQNGVPSAEAARLRLGSQTGLGEDAPAGFRTHKAGTLPDAGTAAKPNAYRVRGQFAFASTDTPEFQQGYANGVQKATEGGADVQTAHKLGLNAAENAVKDAGYDGYFSPKHPNVRFHFGSTEAVPHGPSIAPDLSQWEAPKSVRLSDGTTDFEPAVRNEGQGIDTDAFAKATEQARHELGPGASTKEVIARRDEIVGGKPETRDIGAQSRAKNAEPTREEVRNTRTRTRTPEENADTAAFQQARRELGGGASSDDVVNRAEQILGRPGAYSLKKGTPRVSTNGSGESSASAEAISRQNSNRMNGVKYVKIDSRSGAETPLIGPDALDVQPGPHDIIMQRSPKGDVELSRGAHAR